MIEFNKHTVLIRGAGEIASAIAIILHRVGFTVFLTDLQNPLAIRRQVCFSDAMYNGKAMVEGIQAVMASDNNYSNILMKGYIPLLQDSIKLIERIKPNFLVDARMLKKLVDDRRSLAQFTIGLGPGFTVDINCDAVIETMRGHNLAKVIWQGSASLNTGIPGLIGGESKKRVINAPDSGKVNWTVNIGDVIKKNQVMGKLGKIEIKSNIDGIVRGLISRQANTLGGMKIADIDPRGKEIDINSISDKARTIGRGALEAILVYLNNQ